jgi:hypothetical protein
MMRGVYRFYQDGELLAEVPNLITTEGKRLILRVLAEQASSLGQAIGVGVGNAAALAADTRLQWEVERSLINIKNVDYDNSRVIMKTTLPQNSIYTIYEIGVWSQFVNSVNSDNSSRILTTFESTLESWTNATLDSTQSRTSPDGIKIDATASSTTTSSADVTHDLSGYSALDDFNIAFYKPNNNITTLALKFDSATGSWEKSATISSLPVGYNVITMKKGDFVATGTPDWSEITKMNVKVTAGGTAGYVLMDGIRIEDGDTLNPEYSLVSHSVLSTPLVKTDSSPMDIEYALEFTI